MPTVNDVFNFSSHILHHWHGRRYFTVYPYSANSSSSDRDRWALRRRAVRQSLSAKQHEEVVVSAIPGNCMVKFASLESEILN